MIEIFKSNKKIAELRDSEKGVAEALVREGKADRINTVFGTPYKENICPAVPGEGLELAGQIKEDKKPKKERKPRRTHTEPPDKENEEAAAEPPDFSVD